MAVVDFTDSAQMLQPLDLKLGDRTYQVRPTAADLAAMLRMRRAIAFSLAERAEAEEVAKAKKADPPEPRPLIEYLDGDDRAWAEDDVALSMMQLGAVTYEEMLADGIPFPNIRRMADYSYNYHVGGPEYADAMLKIRDQVLTGVDAEGAGNAEAEFPKRSTSGRPTASGSRTKTAWTGATGRRHSATATRTGSRAKKK